MIVQKSPPTDLQVTIFCQRWDFESAVCLAPPMSSLAVVALGSSAFLPLLSSSCRFLHPGYHPQGVAYYSSSSVGHTYTARPYSPTCWTYNKELKVLCIQQPPLLLYIESTIFLEPRLQIRDYLAMLCLSGISSASSFIWSCYGMFANVHYCPQILPLNFCICQPWYLQWEKSEW